MNLGSALPPPSAKPRRRRERFNPWPLLILAAIAAGIGWLLLLPSGARTLDALTATVVRGDLELVVTERGEMESAESVDIKCDVDGAQIKLLSALPEGTQVKKEDEIAKLDAQPFEKNLAEQNIKVQQSVGKSKAAASDFEVQKNKEASELAKAKLALTLADLDFRSYRDAEYEVEHDDKSQFLELARKELKEAEDKLGFTRNLVKKGFAQLEQQRQTELEVAVKKFSVDRDAAKLKLLENFTKERKLVEFKAKADEAKLDLSRTGKSQQAASEKAKSDWDAALSTEKLEREAADTAKKQIAKCAIKAPAPGILVYYKRPWDDESRVKPGSVLYSQQQMFTLPDLTKMRVKVRVHESVVKKVKVGLPASMLAESLPNRPLHGKVTSVATLARSDGWRSAAVKEYDAEVSIDDLPADAGLKPGMTAEVKIALGVLKAVLMAPVQCVAERRGKRFAYVLSRGAAERREVTVGDSNEQFVELVSGVKEGEALTLDARSRLAAEPKKPGEEDDKPNDKPAEPKKG